MTEKTIGHFVMLPVALLASPAYQALGINARRILDRIEIEHHHNYRKRNGELQVPYSDFVRAGIGRRFISAALRDLEIVGLLEIRAGRCAPNQFRAPNLYRLTYLPTESGEPTNEYKKNHEPQAGKICFWRSRPPNVHARDQKIF
jgi:hypothetical protein